jgi:hypothetical protein
MFIASEAHRFLRRSEVRAGDILITITGNVGRVVHLRSDFPPSNINQHIARIRIADDQIWAAFIFHFLSQPIMRKYYGQITTGQAYPQISLTQVRKTVLPMPPLAEQSATRAAIKKHSGEELDIKPYEADMRHLLNTYIQADPANDLGNLMSSLSLVEMIVQTGIHDAIAKSLNTKGKLSRDAVAEAIINNVRKTIIRNRLTDPRFYAEMSKLLDDLIRQSRSNTTTYEAFLRNAEDLAIRLARKNGGGHPAALNGYPGAIVLFNNLGNIPATTFQCPTEEDERAKLALELDSAMRENAPAVWKGDEIREKQVLNALFRIMSRDRQATQAVFDIIKNQRGY